MRAIFKNPWVRRVGAAAFLFYFLKGMVWLGIAGFLAIKALS